MEAEKRKLRDDDAEVERKRPKHDGGSAVTPSVAEDDEVEEFFAILRRIHAAASYFKGRSRDLTAESGRSSAVGEAAGFDGVSDKGEGKIDEVCSAESRSGLDLNLDPPSKDNLSIEFDLKVSCKNALRVSQLSETGFDQSNIKYLMGFCSKFARNTI